MEKGLTVLAAYNLLTGARAEKEKELKQLKAMWGENPTRRQKKKLAELEAKIAEFNEAIPEYEAFMSNKPIPHPEKEQVNG